MPKVLTPDGKEIQMSMCTCASHCSNKCEKSHCDEWCRCWCHISDYARRQGVVIHKQDREN